MASKADFLKIIRDFAFAHTPDQVDHLAATATAVWLGLTPQQRNQVQQEDYRARIFAAGLASRQPAGVRNGEQP